LGRWAEGGGVWAGAVGVRRAWVGRCGGGQSACFCEGRRRVDGSKPMKFAYLLGLAMTCVAMPALAKPAYVASTVNLRAAPGTGSEIVAKIPGGSLVDASACDQGWCEVAWQDKKGFAIETALDRSGRVPQQRAAAAAAPAPNYRQAPQGPRGPQVVEGPE